MDEKIDLYVFYHIYAAGKWEEPTREFLKIFKDSELNKYSHTLRVGIVGPQSEQTRVIQYLISESVDFEVVAREETGHEQVTQNKVHEFSLTHDGYVLYCHTKGASRQDGVNELWRRSMYYYNIGKWRLAVEKLNTGHDAVGQHWMYPSHHHPEHGGAQGAPFFGGTVWWTSLGLIRDIGPPPPGDRHHAEGWIGYKKGREMKVYDFTGHVCSHPGHIAWTHETQAWV